MDSTDVQDPLTLTFSTNVRDSIYFFLFVVLILHFSKQSYKVLNK